jgi:glutamate/tyrosine decarboxylase-like PLP-dependent enzyme
MTRAFTDQLRRDTLALSEQLSPALTEILAGVDERIALPPQAEQALAGLATLAQPLPEDGAGMGDTLIELLRLNHGAGGNTGGPKCFHFVIGGSTPAAHGADLLATAFEAVPYTWILSPVGVMMELQGLKWLREMLELPRDWAGIMVTGASMANLVCLAAGRQWWGEQQGVDVCQTGMSGLPQMPVFSSGYLHASTLKMLGLLGIGRSAVRIHSRDEIGRVDLDGMAADMRSLDGAPAMMVINAGEVNAGDFDPLAEMMDLAREHNTWVHVDGAFGLFARLSPRTAHLVEGAERADSATVDGHKWLNVPYDSGYAFVRDHGLMARAFRYAADYLPGEDDPRPTLGAIGPESSRRARGFAVWATLKAYGKNGHRLIVEHCLDLAGHLARLVDASDDFERMAEVPLNIVAFRYNPGGHDDQELDEFNARLGERVLADGRFLVGTSRLGPRTIFRPAFSNWRTRPEDIEEFIEVLRELAQGL